jgi:hypothetical protein
VRHDDVIAEHTAKRSYHRDVAKSFRRREVDRVVPRSSVVTAEATAGLASESVGVWASVTWPCSRSSLTTSSIGRALGATATGPRRKSGHRRVLTI